MDAPGLAPSEVIAAYRVLQRVNRQLGHLQSLKRELRRSLAEDRLDRGPMTLLDVGSGSGDLPWELRELLKGRAIPGLAFALDRDPTAVQLSASRALIAVQGDALRLPFPDRSLDLVTAVKFAHHFRGDGLPRLVSEMARVARCRVVILDIRRHWLAYWGFRAWSLLFTRNRLVRHDGPLSVLRAFTKEELADLAAPVPGFSWTVRSYAGFQLALIGRRIADLP
jgi:ubiquinone/menaquinone biosynthesis C-methylase UbiE